MKLVALTAIKVDQEEQEAEKEVLVNPDHIAWIGPHKKGSKLFFTNGAFLTLKEPPQKVDVLLCD